MVRGLDQGFLDIEVLMLDNPVGLGVVWRDVDVVDTIVASEDLECGNVWSAIVPQWSSKMNLAIPMAFLVRSIWYSGQAEREHWIAASSLY